MSLPAHAITNNKVSTFTSSGLVHPLGHTVIIRGDFAVWDDTLQKYCPIDILVRK